MSRATERLPVGRRVTIARAQGIVLVILMLDVLVLLLTGVILFFTYRPAGGSAWAGVFGEDLRSSVDLARATTTTHRLAAQIAMPMAIASGVLIVVEKRPRIGHLDVAVAIGLAVTMVLGWFTGLLLRWDQLGLRAVTVGSDMRGYRPLLDDQVRFVIVDGAQIAPGTLVRWLFVHMVLVGGTLAVLVLAAWRKRSRGPETSERAQARTATSVG